MCGSIGDIPRSGDAAALQLQRTSDEIGRRTALEHATSAKEGAVKYLILIHSNPTTRKVWEGLSDAER